MTESVSAQPSDPQPATQPDRGQTARQAEPASSGQSVGRNESGSGTSQPHGRRNAWLAIGAGAVIFAIGVWIAFALGFTRMRPEFPIDRSVGLLQVPTITYNGAETGWFRLEGEGWDPSREQYGNVAEGDEARCIFAWRTAFIGGAQIGTRLGATDYEATRFLLRSFAIDPDSATKLNLTAANNTRFELLFANYNDTNVSIGHAARAFSASNHMLVFTIMCDRHGAVTPALMNDTLAGVRIELATV